MDYQNQHPQASDWSRDDPVLVDGIYMPTGSSRQMPFSLSRYTSASITPFIFDLGGHLQAIDFAQPSPPSADASAHRLVPIQASSALPHTTGMSEIFPNFDTSQHYPYGLHQSLRMVGQHVADPISASYVVIRALS